MLNRLSIHRSDYNPVQNMQQYEDERSNQLVMSDVHQKGAWSVTWQAKRVHLGNTAHEQAGNESVTQAQSAADPGSASLHRKLEAHGVDPRDDGSKRKVDNEADYPLFRSRIGLDEASEHRFQVGVDARQTQDGHDNTHG